MRVLAPILALMLAAGAAPARAELRVIELRHATPEALLPAIQPLLAPGEGLSAYRNALIVDADAARLARIEQLVRELDVPLRNLLIQVRRRDSALAEDSGAAVRGRIESGDVRIRTGGRPAPGADVEIRASRESSTRGRSAEQSLRALEGTPVLIAEGRLVPLAQGGRWGPQIGYEALEQGFAVSARVAGDTVTLEISARDDRVDGGEVRTGALQSSVSGRLGEWIALGGTQSAQRIEGSGIGAYRRTRADDAAFYEVRVELAE